MKGKIQPGYYRHFKGNLYRVLLEVKHSETCEDLIIYQAMYGNGSIWARPKTMFLEEGRFVKVNDLEALKEVPLYLNPKFHFPDIDYVPDLLPLVESDSMSTPVKSMITLLTNKNIVPTTFFDGFVTDDDLEREILKRVNNYSNGDSLQDSFHLIQVWGGSTGRYIYIFDNGFDWEKIVNQYKALVKTCMSITDLSDSSIDTIVGAVNKFDKSVAHMGIAYITKHTRFWLHRTMGYNALPIYDSVMANCVMRRKSAEAKHLSEYWKVMVSKANHLDISLVPLERQIFKYAYEQR